jgi:hypothetical protein
MAVATKAEVDAVFKVGVGGVSLKGNQYVIKAEEILLKNITDALTRLGANLVSNLEKNAPMSSGGIKKSFGEAQIKESKLGYRIEIQVSADYYDYVDKGVRGVQHTIKNKKVYPNSKGEFYQFETYFMPLKALQNLEGWMKRKNIESDARNLRIRSGDETVQGRRILPQISSSAKRMAYFIKKYGIAGTNFIQKSIDESTPGLEVDLRTIGQNTLILKVSK